MIAVSRTDRGKVRKENEDSLLVTPTLFAVADGMGGHRGGKEASVSAIRVLADCLAGQEPSKDALICAMETANRFVYDRQSEDSALSGMGTTLTVLWAGQAAMTVGHVGDSRAYLARNGTLTQITQDHSLVAELLRNGYIDAAEAANHPYRSVITRAIGSDRMIIPDVFTIPYHSEDRWLICSDGLYDMLDYSHIQDAVISGSVTEAADKLMDQALHNGGRDNISLVLVDCGKAGDADE